MVHIILLILKIIGIAIAVILGLLLLCICIVLFVPVRYRGHMKYDGQFEGEGGIFWFFHSVSIRAKYSSASSDALDIVVRILGHRVFDSKRNENSSSDNTKHRQPDQKPTDSFKAEPEKPADVKVLMGKEKSGSDIKPPAAIQSESKPSAAAQRSENPSVSEPGEREIETSVFKEATTRGAHWQPGRLYKRMRSLGTKLVTKVQAFVERQKQKVKRLLEKLRFVRDKKDALLGILLDEKNRPAFLKIKRGVLRILRHLMPTRLAGSVCFGFDDPASTGYVLGLLSMLYPVFSDHLMLYPNFEKKIFEGEVSFAGRLRVSVFLLTACSLIFDQQIRTVIRSFKAEL